MTPNTPSATSKTVFGCLIVFDAVFALVGIGMGLWLAGDFLDYWKMQSWIQTPATITRAKLEITEDSDGGTTYKATAEYAYQFNNHNYTGHRVSIHGDSDNIGSFQHNVERQLSEHQKSGRPFRCYVNPDNPAESILFRQLRWEMIGIKTLLATIFGAAGYAMLVFSIHSVRKAKADNALAALHPNEPWLCKKAWADGNIKSSSGSRTLFLVLFAFFWNLISTPFLVFSGQLAAKDQGWAYLLWAFPAVGLILILSAIVSVLRWRKYGQSVFEMASMPGVIGGQLAGVIRVSKKVEPEDGFCVLLHCIRKTTTSSGDSERTTETTVWSDEQTTVRDLLQNDPSRSAIPVLFQVPYECSPTDETNKNSQTIWRLSASAKTPGLDFSTSFDVPVFKTPESDPNFVVDRSVIAEYTAPEDPDRDLREAGVLKTESPDCEGFRLVFPMARAPGMGLSFTLIAVAFCSAPFVIHRMGGFAGTALLVTIPIAVVFSLLGLFLLIAAIETWFYRSTIDVSPRGLSVTGGLFGIGSNRWIEAAEVDKIVPVSRMSSGSGKMYYDIDILCKTEKKVTAGKAVPGKRLAESVIRQIEQAMHQQES